MQIKNILMYKENIDGSFLVYEMDDGRFFVPDIQNDLTFKFKETTIIEPDTTVTTVTKSWWARFWAWYDDYGKWLNRSGGKS